MGVLYPEEPKGVLSAATANPVLMRQFANQRAASPRADVTDIFGYGPTWGTYWQNFAQNLGGNLPEVGETTDQRVNKLIGLLGLGGITVYRGGGPGRYWSTSEDYAKEFGPVKKANIPDEQILNLGLKEHRDLVARKFGEDKLRMLLRGALPENNLPFAGDAQALDVLDEIAPALGFKYSMQAEGKGMPPSIYRHK